MSPIQRSEEHIIYRPQCAVCKESVKLEESKADEYGQAIHEECYVSRLTEKYSHLARAYSGLSHVAKRVHAAVSWL